MLQILFKSQLEQRICPTYFDIRLNSDIIWLSEEEGVPRYSELRGTVCLCLNNTIHVTDVKLHFEGWHYVNWDPVSRDPSAGHRKVYWRELPIVHHVRSFLYQTKETTSKVLQPDNYEFPFTFPISNHLPDSVEGLEDSSISYTLRAEIYVGKEETITIEKGLKIRRRYDSLLFSEPKSIENFWSEKVMYSASIPSQAFMFGSEVPLTLRFVPLLKGLELESIKCQLEEVEERARPLRAIRSREILTDEYTATGWGDSITSPDGSEWYHIIRKLQLPRSGELCRQSHLNRTMPISHSIKVKIRMTNPDSHVSLIRLTFPISIYFAECSSVTGDNMAATPIHSLVTCLTDVFLPHYNNHFQDKLPGETLRVVETRENEKEPPSYSDLMDLSTIPSYYTTFHSCSSGLLEGGMQ